MKKVLLTATVQSHICQFHRPLVEVLHEAGYEVHVAAKNNLAEKNGLKLDFVEQVFDIPFSRSPKSTDNLKAYKELKKIIKQGHYDVIHCNTPMGSIVTRLAAMQARKQGTKVFYTAHGFHFYKGAPKKNWIAFYPIEKLMAHLCDKIITITAEDERLAKKRFHTGVGRIHGVGVNPDRYHILSMDEMRLLREKEGISEEDFAILCVGELNQNKNQITLIRAAAELKKEIPNLKILLAGNGPKEQELRDEIQKLDLKEQIKLLGYRTDLECVTPIVDLVVSCSLREGLPLNIIEAMLCKKAVVASVNRGHKELIRNGGNGFLVAPKATELYVEKIRELYLNKSLAIKMGDTGYAIAQDYTNESVKTELRRIYQIREEGDRA